MKLVVLLENETVGTLTIVGIDTDAIIGKEVSVKLHDENGMPIEVTGIVKEVIDMEDYQYE